MIGVITFWKCSRRRRVVIEESLSNGAGWAGAPKTQVPGSSQRAMASITRLPHARASPPRDEDLVISPLILAGAL